LPASQSFCIDERRSGGKPTMRANRARQSHDGERARPADDARPDTSDSIAIDAGNTVSRPKCRHFSRE
jgi:hypothetical protein